MTVSLIRAVLSINLQMDQSATAAVYLLRRTVRKNNTAPIAVAANTAIQRA
jgi:hypothetical protein